MHAVNGVSQEGRWPAALGEANAALALLPSASVLMT
jgi:hypothetical protein